MKRECETCIKRKTMYCPNSTECMVTDGKPYYQDRIMLLEENKQLKELINKIKKITNDYKEYCENCTESDTLDFSYDLIKADLVEKVEGDE